MACTSQSALEYVRSARRQLVNELKDLSVILENLYQEEVFCDEEVINIEAERHDYDKARKTLDSVIKKGEAACYKFLRIIDVTRKRTLGRTSSLPEKTTEASPESQRFNLLYWISCYPFKEDADMYRGCLQGPRSCHTYQTKLKTRARKKSTTFWMRNQKLFDKNNKPDLCYSPLVLDTQGSGSLSKIKKFKNKKSKMSRPKKLRTYLPEDKPNISPSDLLKTDKNILLVGKPGIGKTALGHEILKLWAERESKELDYMFYFDMRETSLITEGMSLEELLFSVYSEPDEGKAEVLQDIKNHSDNVTVILDGVTDLSSSVVKRIVENEILPNAKVIITCRPDDEEEDFLCGDFLRVEVKGFSEQTIQNYFSTILGEEHRKILSQLELLTLCHVPMYALMVAACVLSETTGDSPEPCSMTEIYINIVRFCLQTSSNKSNKHLSSFIQEKKEEILSLAECAFHATQRKTVNLTDFQCEDSCVLSFLKPLVVKVAPTKTKTTYAFLHYTVQEFYAALWLLRNPNQIKDVFQQCLTEERKHMKHLIPFMSRLLTEKSPSLMEHLIPAQELKSTAHWFFKELINTFDSVSTEGSGLDMDLLFFCQCLYESQCPDLCVYFLETLDYHLDLSGESLDSYLCCAVASVVALSKDRKVRLNLEDVSVSEQGMRRLFECLDNVQWCDSLPQQLWKIVFSEGQFQEVRLLSHDGNQFHLPLQGKTQLFERAVNIIQKNPNKVDVCLHWDSRETTFCPSLSESLLEALPRIRSLSFRVTDKGPGLQDPSQGTLEDRVKKKLFMDLCLKAALHKKLSLQDVVQRLMMLFSVGDKHELILDLYQHIQSEGCLSVLPKLRRFFDSAPKVWSIDLSKRKTSILLEVLKLQSQKKPVKLRGCLYEESEVRSLLQCLPFMSQLSFSFSFSEEFKGGVKLCGSLFCAAAERDQQTGENTLELLSSVCTYQTFPLHETRSSDFYQSSFLLDLFSYMKDYETKTGLRVLPSLQSVFQSVPKVWSIDLSKRKTSILLEVLKLQSQKKPVEVYDWSDEESEVRSLLQCLPFMSQLSFSGEFQGGVKLCGSLFCAAAERDQQTGENTLELLSSVCTYQTFPLHITDEFDDYHDFQCDFLLDLFSYMKDYETQTGLRVLPSLQSVFQSVPEVWSIVLSERETSILLEVLKLQSQKKPVEVYDWSDEESEVRSLLQCLPFISQLSFSFSFSGEFQGGVKLCGSLICAAAERDQQTGENTLELLSSVCTYQTFPLHKTEFFYDFEDYQSSFLLDLCSYMKDYETKTGLRVLPSLQSVFQSTPEVWSIDLSKRKTSILLEVLKLQSQKKPVELRGWSYEESEVRSLLQCLPFISQLSCDPKFFQCVCASMSVRSREEAEQLVSLLQLIGFSFSLTGELRSKTCDTIGRVLGLCGSNVDLILTPRRISVRGASLLFRHTTKLHSLSLSSDMALLLSGWVRRNRVARLSVTEELSLSSQTLQPSERVLLRVVSSLASLLRYWTIRRLDLTESRIPAQGLIPLLLHDGPLTIKLSEKISELVLVFLYEIQDKDLTRSFLSKINGDLTPVCLNWEHLHHLLQSAPQTVTVNLRKNRFLQESITRLLPFLDRVVFKRPSPLFVLTAIREIHKTRASSIIPSLLRSFDHVINLTCREMEPEDCAPLLYTLRHGDGVKLNLLWTSIPTEEINSILFTLDRVSRLSVDRNLLLRIVHCCAASDAQQERAVSLLRTLEHRLDLSCSSQVNLSEGGQSETLCLTTADCRAISTILRYNSKDTELQLQDCEVEDSGLVLLFPVLDRVHLRASKDVLLQLMFLVPSFTERDSVSRAKSLCGVLGGELDFSHTKLDERACEALALVLDFTEELTELDLSHCQITDQLLSTLITYLNKAQVLDLSHNNITDASTSMLLRLISINPCLQTVRLFRNNIMDQTPFKTYKQFEIW
ncbi:uncharacterized protein LOC117808220 isoform X4 [Notolabrus celidotus]|uniref:uncharacterized protein LOC117808220 isoform X4 n=1 Tax=Notolabrus celidotus TaxID=1203425 RepID=UPI00148F7E86|nr:uncharacterized protein LOC117808220 isoform X4 [Notolabrus celidotus]